MPKPFYIFREERRISDGAFRNEYDTFAQAERAAKRKVMEWIAEDRTHIPVEIHGFDPPALLATVRANADGRPVVDLTFEGSKFA